jgi:glycosyltransferase involved in cell wall biosynthesis
MTTIADPPTCNSVPHVTSARTDNDLHLAYVVSRFPKPTETFVLAELEALDERGVAVEVFPLLDVQHATQQKGASLWRKAAEVFRAASVPEPAHAVAARWQRRAHYSPLINGQVLAAQGWFLVRHPLRYLRALAGLVVHNIGSPRYLLGGLALFPRVVLMARQLNACGATHLHAHFANQPAAAACVVHRLIGLNYSFTAHGSDLHRDQHMLEQKVRDAAFVVCISEYNRRFVLDRVGRQYADKVHVVHCGVNSAVFAEPPQPRARGRRLRVLQIGSLQTVKGQEYLLKACRALADRGVEIECHFVGDGPDEGRLRELSESLHINERVVFHGYRTPGEVRQHLADTDILACPSVPTSDGRREGIPVVLMEAMAGGVPVVASDLSGIPELVRHEQTGLLFPPADPEQIAAAIERLAGDLSLASRLAAAGREHVLSEFDRDRNVGLLIELFERSALSC